MPAFQTSLSDQEINQIVGWMRTWQKKKIEFQKPVAIQGQPSQGKELYRMFCASCHGKNGEGRQGLGSALNNPRFLQYTTNEQIWISTAYGKEETTMAPSLKGLSGVKQLSEQEISDIVVYIRSWQK